MSDAPAPIGHNQLPEPTPYEAIKVHADDLLLEARNWADGSRIENQQQADALSALIDQLRKGAQAVDNVRKAEKQPHMDAAKAVDALFNPIKDKLDLAVTATKKTLAAWLLELERRQREAAEQAAREAEAARRQAALARALIDESDLEGLEAAAEATDNAAQLAKDAKRAENAKAHATGGARAIGLRSYFTPRRVSSKDAMTHYWATRREEVEAFLDQIARSDVARGVRSIPGYEILEERRAA